MTALAGVTAMDVSVAAVTLSGDEPVIPSKVAEMWAVPGPTPVAVLTPPMVATAGLSDAHADSVVMT